MLGSDWMTCSDRLLASNSSGAATPKTEAGAKPAALHDMVTALEERFASSGLFRRFISAHSARGSRAQEACGLPSFLNATAGHIKCASALFSSLSLPVCKECCDTPFCKAGARG